MIALIQRVSQAKVEISGQIVGEIQQGLLVLLGIEKEDTPAIGKRLLNKVLNYRIFADTDGKMNLNVQQIKGKLLVVSQFTLAANTQKGLRPSFTQGATPQLAQALYQDFVNQAQQQIQTEAGEFASDMQVSLTNDGPVTFWLQVN